MLTIPGYEPVGPIHDGQRSTIIKARRSRDGQPVVLKVLKHDSPSADAKGRYQRETEILQALQESTSVVRLMGVESNRLDPVLILEDFGADSLAELRKTHSFNLEETLSIGLQLTDSLEQIHSANIIHQDINPGNILYNPATCQIKIIDFGISTMFPKENPMIKSPDLMEGTPAYLSPEQTGRMNRMVDFRTDYFSLGVTLYELLTGRLPFDSTDPNKLVYFHLATRPIPPHELSPDIPRPVSAVVMKLLSKTPEERYQSAVGLREDLQECLRQWKAGSHVKDFPLGARDVSSTLMIPQKLYGREQETTLLMEAWERVAKGQREVMLISGLSGIGKTALVKELSRPLTLKQGFFISGKFNRQQRGIPYSAFPTAFSLLVKYIQSEPADEKRRWRERILTAVGNNGQVILELFPEFGLIIGPQPKVAELGAAERQNRFERVFQQFISVFAKPEHPLVLFLDDLQWADAASVKLVHLALTSRESQSLFVIGAYRDNELESEHSLNHMLAELRRGELVVHHLPLGPLELPHVTQMLAETFQKQPTESAPLATVVLQKTEGNPLFIREFLDSLHRQGLVVMDRKAGAWRWDPELIKLHNISENVADLLVGKIHKLGWQTQKVLKIAACLGNPFGLPLLAMAAESTQKDILEQLRPAIATGLVLPLGESGPDKDPLSTTPIPEVQFKFAHDRILQAAYSLLKGQEKTQIHHHVGQILRQRYPLNQQDHRLFEIADHLNLAREIFQSQPDRDELARINFLAAQKAKASVAHESALRHLTIAIELLGVDSWQRQYDLTLNVYLEAAEAAYLMNEFEKTDRWTQEAQAKARSVLDRARVFIIRIESYTAQNNPLESVNTGLEALALLNVHFPKSPNKIHVLLGYLKTRRQLARTKVDDLQNLPEMSDPEKLIEIRIMRKIAATVYFSNPMLAPLVLFRQLSLSLRYGNHPMAPAVYAAYGLILCGLQNEIDLGYQFGTMAEKLIAHLADKQHQARTIYLYNAHIRHWKEELGKTLERFIEGYQRGLECGDYEWAALNCHLYCNHAFFLGQGLVELDQRMSYHQKLIGQLNQKTPLHLTELFHQCVLNLMGKSENHLRLVGEAFDEDKLRPFLLETKNGTLLFGVHYHNLYLACLFHDYEKAVAHAAEARTYVPSARGLFAVSRFEFFAAIAHLGRYPKLTLKERFGVRRRLKDALSKLKLWTKHAPMNHAHLHALLEAERFRLNRQHSRAAQGYARAIALARDSGFINDEAFLQEMAGRYYLSRGHGQMAEAHFQDAERAYSRFGAAAKAKDMKRAYAPDRA